MIRINSIDDRGSICDGPGIRTVLFLQGCIRHCPNCHNPSTWDVTAGTAMEERELAELLAERSVTGRITISGGEPLLQKEALMELLKELKERGLEIALYTGYELDEIPESILSQLDYIKVGSYVDSLRTTVAPYVGSTNQKFIKLAKKRGEHYAHCD